MSIGPRQETVTTRPPQILALTTMRGLAVWWVALYHFREYLPISQSGWVGQFISEAYYGLDFFFVLSGFVLQINYAAGLASPTRASLRTFAIARFARIYPLHLFMMLVYVLIPLSIVVFSQRATLDNRYSLEYFLLSLLLLQNWGFVGYLGWNVPAWSISTEFASYLVFPLAAMVIMRRRDVASTLVLLVLVLAAIAALFGLNRLDLRYDTVYWGLPRCVLEFFVGMCVGRVYQLRGAPEWGLSLALLAVAIGLTFGVLTFQLQDYYALPCAYAMLIYCFSRTEAPLSRALSVGWLVYLGEISYATYLSHYFIREVIKFFQPVSYGTSWGASILYIVITLAASILLYHVVELPTRHALRRVGQASDRARSGIARRPAE